jgi:outer membrane immunogenic protein
MLIPINLDFLTGGSLLNKLVLGGMALIALGMSAPAVAADMPVKVKAPPPVVLYDWSGVYVGFHAGYDWQRFDWAFNPPVAGAVNQTFALNADNWTYGVHGGAQVQWGQIVLGVEAALSGMGGNYARHLGYGTDFGSFADAKITELFTVGGRLGWTPLNNWLLYVNGGYANGLVKTRLASVATGLEVAGFGTQVRQDGWYVGGGFDYLIHKGALVDAIVGLEYQHVDLGTDFHCIPSACAASNVNNHDLTAKVDIVRARLTIKTQGYGWWGPM